MVHNVTSLVQRRKLRMSDFYNEGWGAWSDDGFAELARRRDFTGETLRVLLTIISSLGKGNYVCVDNADIARYLGIRTYHAARQIRMLASAGVLLAYEKNAYRGWRLNPRYGFKGEPDKSLRRTAAGKLVLVD